jgi:hypothetical protein
MINFKNLSATTGLSVYDSAKARPDRGGQMFGRLRTLFGVYQNLFAASVPSVGFHLTALSGSTYLCNDAFPQMKIIKSRFRNHLTDEHLKFCFLCA